MSLTEVQQKGQNPHGEMEQGVSGDRQRAELS